ncbi:General secretion pathway protein E [Vibrio crassostreae]|uniref:GspE/PulE family protein n=1 Tax=Vibrio crassostreae TaxID=246167 RepID=UPI00104A7397|nr:ATPase, T2SS/T4P/T4SS family [Vibrio crassostreae]MDH5951251.1 Flp pilus assembly complex ATPase component TadA [Vibrio crassostreae]TCU02965.1 general secretion pathway protein E [Vibrio crassostreae]CAK1809583.1 General secretion pathway protein E [Vibrio crassostreae]CAK1811020.1 General secretion pathway protein E [Vibrio crassostreae]CAK1900725.1 General secretion pathway protein E [Vibrio crassostreae]
MNESRHELSLLHDQTLLELCIEDGHTIVDEEGVIWVDCYDSPKHADIRRYVQETESLSGGRFFARPPMVTLTDETRVQTLLDMARTLLNQETQAALESAYGDKLTQLCQAAVEVKASDIHLEVHRNNTNILLRVDGRRERLKIFAGGESAERLDRSVGQSLAAYIFSLGNSNYSPRLPLNDRFELPCSVTKLNEEGESHRVTIMVEWRVAMMPLSHGIKLVLRCLTPLGEPLTLDNMDLLPAQRDLLESKMQRRSGIIVLTGPMGSGKTSLVYALFDTVDRVARCCHTLEDPIEFEQAGITKTLVEPKRELVDGSGQYLDYTFYALEQLRQDIDITSFGELRSHDTTKEFTRKGETGGLALSTLHANSALGVPAIFIEQLGIPSSIVSAPGLMQLFTHQKLVRKLCPHCALTLDEAKAVYEHHNEQDAYQTKLTQVSTLLPEAHHQVRVKHPAGCEHCRQTGESGRLLVLELIAIEDADREFIKAQDYLGWSCYLQAQGWPDIRRHTLHRIALGQVDIASASEQVDGLMPVSSQSLYQQIGQEMDRQANADQTEVNHVPVS